MNSEKDMIFEYGSVKILTDVQFGRIWLFIGDSEGDLQKEPLNLSLTEAHKLIGVLHQCSGEITDFIIKDADRRLSELVLGQKSAVKGEVVIGGDIYENLFQSVFGLDNSADAIIYLKKEKLDLFEIEAVQNATGNLMEALGFELENKAEPVYGSFFQRIKFFLKQDKTQQEVDKAYEKAKLALEAKYLGTPTADATSKIAIASAELIKSLEGQDEAVIRLGVILLVKTVRDGKSLIMAETVTPELKNLLDSNPNLLKNPSVIYDLLNTPKPTAKELKSGEGEDIEV